MRITILLALAVALAALAQSNNEPATITRIEGAVYLNDTQVTAQTTLAKDATVRTAAGRAAIHLRGSSMLFLGENTSVRVIENRPYNFNRLEMIDGSAVVITVHGSGMVVCEDTVNLSDRALVRLDLHPIAASPYGEHSCSIKVYEGAASAQLPTFAAVLRAGQTMSLNKRAGDMIPTNDFNVAQTDDLDRWSVAQR